MNYLRDDERDIRRRNQEAREVEKSGKVGYVYPISRTVFEEDVPRLLGRLIATRRTAFRLSLLLTCVAVFLLGWIVLPLLAGGEITAPEPMATRIPPTTSLIPAITLRPTYPICIEPTGIPTPEPIRAVATGQVWLFDGPGADAEAITAAVPQGAELTVIESGLQRTHVIWEVNSDTYVVGWIENAWIEALAGEAQ